MNISVAICTWNRSEFLNQTLKTLTNVRIPQGTSWEVLVVNNNCTDDTDEVVRRYAAVLPVRLLFEPQQGHANARNCT